MTDHKSDGSRGSRKPEIYAVDSKGEVRAGPGDAGGREPPDVACGAHKRGGRGLFIALLVAGPLLVFAFWLFTR